MEVFFTRSYKLKKLWTVCLNEVKGIVFANRYKHAYHNRNKFYRKFLDFKFLVVYLQHENNNNTNTIAATDLSEVNGYVLNKI